MISQGLSVAPITVGAAVSAADAARLAVTNEAPLNVQWPEYGAKGDGTTDDTAAYNAAINAVFAAGGGTIISPNTPNGYRIDGTITVPAQTSPVNAIGINIKGVGGYTMLKYNGTGTMFSLPGTSGSTSVPYVVLEDLRLIGPNPTGLPTGTTVGIAANYANVCTLSRVFIKGFGTGLQLGTLCTGWKLYQVQITRNVTGLTMGNNCGGFGFFGGQLDSNLLGFNITGDLNVAQFHNVEIDTDSDGTIGTNSVGGGIVNGPSRKITFDNCGLWSEAPPSQGAGIVLTGGCQDVVVNNCHFNGVAGLGAASPAAIKFDTTSFVKIIGGQTINHSGSSYICTTNAANILLLDPNNQEAPAVSGTGATIPVVLRTANNELFTPGAIGTGNGAAIGGAPLVVLGGESIQLNKSDDSAQVSWEYNSGRMFSPNPVMLTGLPAADPHVVGALWANVGVVTVSAG